MSAQGMQSVKSGAIGRNGRLLVFASPIMTGFLGSPLALSTGKVNTKRFDSERKNWAKRRAYEA